MQKGKQSWVMKVLPLESETSEGRVFVVGFINGENRRKQRTAY